MEFFEAIKTFITAVRSEPSGFKEVAGTKISDEYFAYKDSKSMGKTKTERGEDHEKVSFINAFNSNDGSHVDRLWRF